jgi:Leucine-rich repeat (LRR) protein
LGNNELEEIPTQVENLKSLELLALDHNKLKDLEPASKLELLSSNFLLNSHTLFSFLNKLVHLTGFRPGHQL